MNRFPFIPLVLAGVVACGDGVTEPKLMEDAWDLPASGGLQALSTSAVPAADLAAGGKPLTTLAFDEVPFQPVDGLSVKGVNFAFDIGGVPSTDARYNAFGPGPGPFVQCPCMEGRTTGTLTITFDKPTQVVAFGAALSTGASLSPGFTVDVIGPNGKSRGVFNVATSPAPAFTGAQFSYSKNAVKQLVVTFNSGAASRFAIDNLSYHQAPR